jgi:hypothetical protein
MFHVSLAPLTLIFATYFYMHRSFVSLYFSGTGPPQTARVSYKSIS